MLLNVSFESRFQQEKVSEKSAEKGDVSFQRIDWIFIFYRWHWFPDSCIGVGRLEALLILESLYARCWQEATTLGNKVNKKNNVRGVTPMAKWPSGWQDSKMVRHLNIQIRPSDKIATKNPQNRQFAEFRHLIFFKLTLLPRVVVVFTSFLKLLKSVLSRSKLVKSNVKKPN